MPNKRIKVIYLGTPQFAVPALEVLFNTAEIEVLAVVTQADKKVGRKQVIAAPPVKEVAQGYNASILQPENMKDRSFLSLIKQLEPDVIVVVAYGKILPPELLKIPKYGCINLHGSLLPKYRGASPVEEALLQGETETGITFIKMDEGLDTGDILLAQRVHIEPTDNALSLRQKLSQLGAAQLPYLLRDLVEDQITPIPQNSAKASYCHKISKKDGSIDLKVLTANEIRNRIRAYTPWPSCFLIVQEKRLKILDIELDETSPLRPGEGLIQRDGSIALGTKKGAIILKKIQLEGKNPMIIQDFLRGNSDFFKNSLAKAK